MSLQTRITALATAIGADVKALRAADGDLSALATVAKSNLVAAINEIVTAVAAASNINDSAGNGNTTATWSADKIFDSIEAAKTAVKNEVLGGAAAAFDTLSELAAALGRAFAGAGQEIPPDYAGPPGHVRITALPGGDCGHQALAPWPGLLKDGKNIGF